MTDKYTPYLTAHPEISILLDGVGQDLRYLGNGEYFFFHFVNRFGQTVWSSPRLTLTELAVAEIRRIFPGDSYRGMKVYFQYYRIYNGSAYRVTNRVSPQQKKLRASTAVAVQGSNAQIQAFVRISRRRVRPQINSWSKRVIVPSSSSLRPNPETIQKGFLHIIELNSGTYSITVTPSSRTIFTRTWSGVRTPGYGSLKKRQLPVNPHVVSIVETPVDVLVEVNQTVDGPAKGTFSSLISRGTNHYPPPEPPSHNDQARNLAIKRLIVNGQLGIQANLAQDIAQVGQTLNLIGSTTRQIAGSLKALKSGNIPKAVKVLWGGGRPVYRKGQKYQPSALSSVANNWLAMQYGWKPLLQDIHGAFQSLQSLSGSADFVQTATASGTFDSQTENAIPLWAEPAMGNGKETIFTSTRCKFVLRYRIASPLKSFMAQTGFTNPVNLAWEILPFSFVADWFLPIGPFLETLSAWDGLEFVDGSQTLFTRSTAILAVNVTGRSIINPFILRTHRASRVQTTVLLDRSKLTSFPAMSVPSFKNPLASVDHALNGLALLQKVFRT